MGCSDSISLVFLSQKKLIGDDDGIRTHDSQRMRLLLYQTELRRHSGKVMGGGYRRGY